jgi:hypothetical protein
VTARSGCSALRRSELRQVHEPGRIVSEMRPRRADPVKRYLPGSPFNAPDTQEPEEPVESYEPRDLVSHDKYGLGSVLDVEGQVAVLVDFGTHRRRITLPCARLVKL